MFKKVIYLALACAAISSFPSYAGFQAQRISANNIKLDGKLDDSAWLTAPVFDRFYQTQPLDRVAAHVKTEVKVLYDEQYLYVGIKGYEPQPEAIRAPFARRDKISSDQDYFGLYIDASSGHKAAQVFYVNARGTIMDGIYADASGEDTAPDYEFEVATARFEGGWSAEYKIPFSAIAYDKNSTTPWSLLVMRNMTRDQRYRMYSGEVTRATSCNLCFSDPIEGMTELPSATSWSATPQLVMRRQQERTVGELDKSSSSRDLSLDVKFRPNSTTTIDGTINPDFSQIELDSPQLSGNTRFGLFVPEKRPFFLEGADIFKTPFNVISTRSIASPDVGLRYTRRDADKDFSVLSSRDAAGGTVPVPHTYYTAYAVRSVASVATDARANFRFGALSLGAVMTDRTLANQRGYNRVAGPDFVWQVSPNQLMRGQLLSSASSAMPDAKGNLEAQAVRHGHAAFFDWSRGDDQWSTSTSVRDISDDFRADNGFFSQVGYRSLNTDVTKKLGKTGIWNELNVYLQGEYKQDSKGQIISRGISPGVRVAGPLDSQIYFNLNPSNKSRIDENGSVFSTTRFSTGFGLSPSKQIARLSLDVNYGDSIDITSNRLGRGGSYTFNTKLRPWDRLELEANVVTSWIDSQQNAGRERAYTENALQINGIFHFSGKDTLRMILQNASTTRNPALYQAVVAAQSTRNVNSFVYTHMAGLGTATYLGWTRSKYETPGLTPRRVQNELFGKFSWQM
ncbi:MAG: carbohydrate binding family 9 domain-containing protein [Undibacterium sp.]|nr:carbohydrate binding family 9 domain-containing protein [Undibacterium sp.]